MIGKAKRGLAALAIAVLMTIGPMSLGAIPSASAASGTISGTVTCFWDNNAEVGVWVDATYGADGWASWYSNGDGSISYSYTLSQSSSYTLRIGCGGTPSAWDKSFTIYPYTVNGQYYDWICTFQSGAGYVCYQS